MAAKFLSVLDDSLKRFFLRTLLLHSHNCCFLPCLCEEEGQGDLGRWGGVMVDAEEQESQQDGKTVAGLTARVGWVPECACALWGQEQH